MARASVPAKHRWSSRSCSCKRTSTLSHRQFPHGAPSTTSQRTLRARQDTHARAARRLVTLCGGASPPSPAMDARLTPTVLSPPLPVGVEPALATSMAASVAIMCLSVANGDDGAVGPCPVLVSSRAVCPFRRCRFQSATSVDGAGCDEGGTARRDRRAH